MFEEKYAYRGWKNCLRISNSSIDLIATSDIGPRIIRFGFIDEPNIFLELEDDMGKTEGDDWRLYGGTRLWHAPESIPRTYFPDNRPVSYDWDGKVLRLTQETEQTTGLQKEIEIILNEKENRVDLNYRIYNRNLWPVKFTVWALSVLQKTGIIIIPQEPYQSHSENLLPVRPIVLWAYTDMSDPRWKWGRKYIQLRQDPELEDSQKIGLLNKSGWAAYYVNGCLLIKTFKFFKELEYPDFNSNMEVYTDKDIVELETLSQIVEVEPGCFAEHKESWYLFKVDLDYREDVIDKKILPLLKKTAPDFRTFY